MPMNWKDPWRMRLKNWYELDWKSSRAVLGMDKEVKLVEMLPHLGGNLFAHAAGVLAGAGDTGMDAVGILLLEGDELDD